MVTMKKIGTREEEEGMSRECRLWVYFKRRKKERGGDGVVSAPCGLVCYRANEHEIGTREEEEGISRECGLWGVF